MILIADSGSTKTDWRLIDENRNIKQFSTLGFNPFFQSEKDISLELKQNLLPHLGLREDDFLEIHFYGAGCSSDQKCEIVKEGLSSVFKKSKIKVEHDLLAAARALCGQQRGIAAILGTGSNSCYYNGEEITEHIPSLGFILGDEGSGAHLGKKLIAAYLYNEMPLELAKRFNSRFNLSKDDILDAIYKKTLPSRYLASFSKFILQNIKEQFLVDLVTDSFSSFFDHHICKYEKHKVEKFNCVGSVGFYFSNILRGVAAEKGVNVGKIIETPIAGLTLYHIGEE